MRNNYAFPCLSASDAARILKKEGPNELPEDRETRVFRARLLLDVLKEPMLLLLFLCSAVYFFIGDFREGVLLIISADVVAFLTFIQRFKAEKALNRLKMLSSPRASVIRDKVEVRIAGREVVPWDLLVLREGDRIAADGDVLQAEHLEIDESSLTGESLLVQKGASFGNGEKSIQKVFAGTLVRSGHGMVRVTATGHKTELGKIGKSLQTLAPPVRTAFQQQMIYVVRVIGSMAILFCLVVVLLHGKMNGNWPEAVLAGLATAMSMLPEEMPLVVTLFLVLGAWRISKHSVLTRRMAAIENLGATTVLCVDKTGTLTENKMKLKTLWSDSSETKTQLLMTVFGANHSTPYDPMEKAIEEAFREDGDLLSIEMIRRRERAKEYNLSAFLPVVSVAWRESGREGYWIATKGAPEAVLALCDLTPVQHDQILQIAQDFSAKGQRILGVAECEWKDWVLPEDQRHFPLRFVGLVGFEDPIRSEVPEALADCYRAGIRVIMMTGDHPGTAQAVASKIGLNNAALQITGAELEAMTDQELGERISTVNIFARLRPEQKLRLVKALQMRGELVSMTGDGINDAPSLKSADIGIAMGKRGTDVAREASDIVLIDDNFASIVSAIRLGRRIFENVRNAISYIMAIHVPIAGLVILPVILKLPLVLLPAQIVFLEFIIDPACSFVFEAEREDADIMSRKPRNRQMRLFGREEFLWGSIQGAIVLCLVMAVYLLSLRSDTLQTHARSLTFMSLVFGNLGLIFVNRSRTLRVRDLIHKDNRVFQAVTLGVFISIILVSITPFLRNVFAFGQFEIKDIGIALAVGLLTVLLAQTLKRGRLDHSSKRSSDGRSQGHGERAPNPYPESTLPDIGSSRSSSQYSEGN